MAVFNYAESGATCLINGADLDPCTIVIFGATGDLAAKKLIPALLNLHGNRTLPRPCVIVGCGRTPLDDEGFRQRLQKNCPEETRQHALWDEFLQKVHYQAVRYDDPDDYQKLVTRLKEFDESAGTAGNRIFDLAVPPSLYPMIATRLGGAGLAEEAGSGWSRIVVEKPFGRDLASARQLDMVLHQSFTEQQIFRIDHYLAKETVQNVILLRFANALFEPLWNRNYIDYVGIVAAESVGVESRAGYYEEAGVIRDMFQNHLLQLLALIAMEPPSVYSAERVRDEKTKVFRSLRPFSGLDSGSMPVLGQYAKGVIDGAPVVGYRQESGVGPNSTTPTFAMMKVFIDNWRWNGVPFYLASGKRLPRKDTRMVIQFKGVPHSLFRDVLGEGISANRLTLGIFPEEEIQLSFQTKVPGPRICLRNRTLNFKYSDDVAGPKQVAYEKVLVDCIQGEQMFFWRQDGVELAWEFLDPILEICEACTLGNQGLETYRAGEWGPQSAGEWISRIMS